MIHHGDLFDVLPTLDAESMDACVTDPPYDLTSGKRGGSGEASLNLDSPAGRSRISTGGGFMGQKWDGEGVAFRPETWCHVLRVLKPGGYLAAFGGPRTFHRMTSAIEDAGLEIRDCLSWLYGQGFPKSLNVGDGRGTALKPSWEPIILARKPTAGTVKANVERYGTAALNIDACRIGNESTLRPNNAAVEAYNSLRHGASSFNKAGTHGSEDGRWPANVLLDEEAAKMLDEQTADVLHSAGAARDKLVTTDYAASSYNMSGTVNMFRVGDSGGASRFYYVAKPSREERDFGCEGLDSKLFVQWQTGNGASGQPSSLSEGRNTQRRNIHPTVKPVELMRWLVKLVTPIDGVVLDPFTGSGTTGMACRYEHRKFIGIEREAEYVRIAEARIAAVAPLFHSEVSA